MSNFQRILNMASKALGTSGHSSSNTSGATDWRDVVRSAADKVTGDSRPAAAQPASGVRPPAEPAAPAPGRAPAPRGPADPEDTSAIARYDYLLKTARPEQLEQVHRDAFARLTPAQRDQVSAQLRAELPATEHPVSAEPADLARAAARGEAHKPGFLRGMFARNGGRGGAGALAGVGAVAGAGLGAAGGLLAAVAGGAVLSSVAAPILEQAAGLGVDFESLAGGVDGLLGDQFSGQLTDLGSTIEAPALGDLASNFEIPGLGDLGRLFGRDS